MIYAQRSSRFAVLMRINNIKLELKIKRTKQIILVNRPEAASVSVHERASLHEALAICTRKRAQSLFSDDYIHENEYQRFLIQPLLGKQSESGCHKNKF